MRSALDQLQHQRRARRLEQHGEGAVQQLRHGEAVHLRRVVQRQGGQRPVVAAHLQLDVHAAVFRQHGAMRHHRALRLAGGAGGVLQLRQVGVLDALPHRRIARPAPARVERGGEDVVPPFAEIQRAAQQRIARGIGHRGSAGWAKTAAAPHCRRM